MKIDDFKSYFSVHWLFIIHVLTHHMNVPGVLQFDHTVLPLALAVQRRLALPKNKSTHHCQVCLATIVAQLQTDDLPQYIAQTRTNSGKRSQCFELELAQRESTVVGVLVKNEFFSGRNLLLCL